MATKDEMALARYGTSYDRLSAFGKRDIDRAFDPPTYTATLPTATEEVVLRQSNVKMAEQLEAVSQENIELWNENTELKAELEELRSQFNPRS